MNSIETVVISVGGSLIVPDQINTDFLSSLKELVETEVKRGRRFVLIAGGGRTARRYQEAATAVTTLTPDDRDWLGLHATHLNGHLLRTILFQVAYPIMIKNPDDILDVPADANVIIAAGYRPGCSTDFRSIQIADRLGAKKVINLSNIEYVYTADPKIDPNAQKIEDITWEAFRKLIPEEWDPGLSTPFDPVAAREAQKNDIEVSCVNKIEELQKYLDGEPFIGTRIHN